MPRNDPTLKVPPSWRTPSLIVLLLFGCGGPDPAQEGPAVPADPDAFVSSDSARIMDDLRDLSHDSLQGRRTGTRGGEAARSLILSAFQEAGLSPSLGGFLQPFQFQGRRDSTRITRGANVVGMVPGRSPGLGAIVVTAHFDHLGVRAPRPPAPGGVVDSIFNGADDNASGTAALMALGRYVVHHPLRHTVVLAAVDAEEMGLRGSRAFLEGDWPGEIVLNVNLDMVARSDSLLFAAGTYHNPWLRTVLEAVRDHPPVVLRFGHDRPGVPGVQDWTGSSDHRPFHERGIPFVYFGVEDHPDYHRPSDEFEAVEPAFFLNAVRTILASVLALDEALAQGGAGAADTLGSAGPRAPSSDGSL